MNNDTAYQINFRRICNIYIYICYLLRCVKSNDKLSFGVETRVDSRVVALSTKCTHIWLFSGNYPVKWLSLVFRFHGNVRMSSNCIAD